MKRKSATWRGGGEAPAEAKQLGLTELGLLMKKGSPEELKGPEYGPIQTKVADAFGLRCPADTRALFLNACYFASLYFAWQIHPSLNSWLSVGVLVAWLGFFGFIGATTVHNTMHCRVFKSTQANKIWQGLLSLTYGHTVSTYVPGHNLSHHKYTQQPKDVMRTTKLRFKWNLWNGLFFQQSVAFDVLVNDLRYITVQTVHNASFFRNCLREFIILLSVQVVLGILDWRRMLLYFYLPHLFAQWGIVSINLVQHDGCDEIPDGAYTSGHKVEYINLARNLTSPLINWCTMNNGFHTAHHLYPTMHWSFYPECHDKVVKPRMDPRLDEPSLAAYCFRTFIYPAKRVRFDGGEIIALQSAETGDLDWIRYPEQMPKEKVDEIISVKGILTMIAFLPFKVIAPMWSPIGNTI